MNVFRYVKETLIGKMIAAFAIIMLPALVEELFSLNDLLAVPLQSLADWKAEGTFYGRLKFVLLLVVYLPPLVLLWALVASWWKKDEVQVTAGYQSKNDYDKMIAQLVQAVTDPTVANELKAERVNLLFHALIDDICGLYSIPRHEVRAVLVGKDRDKQKLTSWRWGRTTTVEQDKMDLKAVAVFLETEKTYPTWENARLNFEYGDSDTMFFIRNKGELQLGILLAVSGKVNTQEKIEEWAGIVYPFTMLGHMDKLVCYVVHYR